MNQNPKQFENYCRVANFSKLEIGAAFDHCMHNIIGALESNYYDVEEVLLNGKIEVLFKDTDPNGKFKTQFPFYETLTKSIGVKLTIPNKKGEKNNVLKKS